MSKKVTTADFLKVLMNQIEGNADPDKELIPEYGIIGTGDIWCYDPSVRNFKRISRGVKVFVLMQKYDNMGRSLVYTINGDLVCIDPDELILTGFD